jgi:hypothetical protein
MRAKRPDRIVPRAFRAAILAVAFVVGACPHVSSARDAYRGFSDSSYWNSPLPGDVPIDPNSAAILSFIRGDSTTDYISLRGADRDGEFGNPIYWADGGDSQYDVRDTCYGIQAPPEFGSVRIPRGARPDPTADGSMTIYDTGKGRVYGLFHATYNAEKDQWASCGGTIYYLNSNGLDGELPQSDEPRNTGHRGLPPPTYAVRLDEVNAGAINHVLKISVDTTRCQHVFPMTGDECGTSARYAPPEGTRIRIRPTIDLSKLKLSPAALVVATALQRFGAVIGDQSGGPVGLKVENCIAEGKGWKWNGLLHADALAPIPLELYEVVQLGWHG